MTIKTLIGILVTINVINIINFLSSVTNSPEGTIETGTLNFTGLSVKYGMPCEEYEVTTEDGYILKLFRIPGEKRRPILLVHGLLDSSDVFLLRGHSSITCMLSKEGYDIWGFNYRGNKYSRRHNTLHADKDSAFWNFGLHEYALYDLTSSIDFILNKTNANRLSIIAHSEGTSVTLAMTSLKPEYNEKINVFVAWSPICFMHGVTSRLPWLIEFGNIAKGILNFFQIDEVMSYDSMGVIFSRFFCTKTTVGAKICRRAVLKIMGDNPDGLETDFVPVFLRHFPTGTSRKNLEHTFQLLVSGRFAQFDYGEIENLAKYKSKEPPEYNLDNVTMKVALLLGENDNFSTRDGVHMLSKKLPNVVVNKFFAKLNHIDYILGQKASSNVFPTTLQILQKYN